MEMTKQRRAEIAERCAKATEPPWEVTHNTLHEETRVYANGAERAMLDGRVLMNQRADGDFIAHARTDIVDLLAALDAAEARARASEAEVMRLKECGVMWANLRIAVEDVRLAYERTKGQPHVLYDGKAKPVMAASWRHLVHAVTQMLSALAAPAAPAADHKEPA